MKKRLFALLLSLACLSLYSQEVIGSGGTGISNTSGSIDFTIGEVVIATISTASNALTQGFHQNNLGVLDVEDFDLIYQARAYPNPTPDILNLEIQLFEGLNYRIYDLQGRQLAEDGIAGKNTPVSMQKFAKGMYLLIISNEYSQKLKTYRIIKN